MSEEIDHRQIKEDHIEIYGSEGEGAGGDPGDGGSGGGERNPGSDYEISQEMYQDDDMQDDGSQVRSEGQLQSRVGKNESVDSDFMSRLSSKSTDLVAIANLSMGL